MMASMAPTPPKAESPAARPRRPAATSSRSPILQRLGFRLAALLAVALLLGGGQPGVGLEKGDDPKRQEGHGEEEG